MTVVASRDLRNHTADVLRQVAGGERVTITTNGVPVAEIAPLPQSKPTFLSKATLMALLDHQADPGLTRDLQELSVDTTDDLDPL